MTRLRTILLLFALACAGTPEAQEAERGEGDCERIYGESAIEFECGPEEQDGWSERALEEAEDDMEERRPERRR